MPTRREFLAGALALLAAACTGGTDRGPNPPPGQRGSIRELTRGAPQLSILGVGPGAIGGDTRDPIQTGSPIVTFDLSVSNQLIVGGTPQVYLAKDETHRALGPFPAAWTPFTAYDKTGDRSPKSPIPGVYAAEIKVPSPGLWTIAAVGPGGRSQGVAETHVFTSDDVLAAVGSKAIPVATPVATSQKGLLEVCTRMPPDPMHYIALDEALRNGKPTVAVFSTPEFCESRLCGPVTDEALLVFRKLGKAKVNFVHVEEFLPGPDLKPDASKQSPAFRKWGFLTEPWTIVIDGNGVIRRRFEGSVTAPVIDAALRPLL
jgi:hypothetical protein